jgi:hypothetical protein
MVKYAAERPPPAPAVADGVPCGQVLQERLVEEDEVRGL